MTIAGVIVVSAYIAAQMMADVMSLKIAVVAGLSVDAGTFIYPFTFTLRDLVHKLLGRASARAVIITAAAVNLIMAGMFAFAAWLPADPTVGPQESFTAVLAPVWRIVVASILAEVVSEFVDTEVYHLWVTRVTRDYQWARVLVSNAFSLPVDSLIFSWGAFGGVFPTSIVWSIFLTNVLIKTVVTLVSLPGIYLVGEREASQIGTKRANERV